MWHLFLLRLIDNNISHHILHVDVLWKHTLSSMLSSVFVTLELVSLGCRTGPVHELKVSALLCREAGRKRFFFFLIFVFHIQWLNFTLHWHMWGDVPWNQSNSGISEEQYFEPLWDMWSYYFPHLQTDYAIMWQLQR